MAQEIFVNNSKLSAPEMTSDSRETQRQGGAASSFPKNMTLTNIFATFYATSSLLEQVLFVT